MEDYEQEQEDLELVECWMFVMAVLLALGLLGLLARHLGIIL